MQPFPLLAALALAAALATPARAQTATPVFTEARRDALRDIWRTDPAIRDHAEPGDEARGEGRQAAGAAAGLPALVPLRAGASSGAAPEARAQVFGLLAASPRE